MARVEAKADLWRGRARGFSIAENTEKRLACFSKSSPDIQTADLEAVVGIGTEGARVKTLYLVRHGLAEEADVFAARPDAERRLTAKGRKKADQAAKGLGRMKCAPDRIVSSPLVRAEETAAILARRLAPRGRRELSDRLSPRASVSGLIRWLARQRGNSILLVGHMPMLGELASVLLGGGGRAVIQLKKSGACCFTFSGAIRPGRATLAWLMPPAGLSRV